MSIRIFFYKIGGRNIPIAASDISSPENAIPSLREIEAIYQQWPQARGNLFMRFEGVTFALDSGEREMSLGSLIGTTSYDTDGTEKRLREITDEAVARGSDTVLQELEWRSQNFKREVGLVQALSLALLIVIQICLAV